MSSKKNRGSRNNGSSPPGSGSPDSASPAARKPHVRRSFIDRLVAKSEDMYSLGADIAKMISGRSAPGDIATVAQEFVGVLEKYREQFFALRASGWSPPEAATKAEIKVGDTVTITKSALDKYSFIEGLADGSTKLVVAKFMPRGEGKVIDVLVKDAVTGAPYGLVLKSLLIPA